MNLKNPDLFRSWLIRQLEPICKANPEPVSKYVCALLKKEKTDDELRQSLVSQLDIFLDAATEEFVTFLIDILKEEKYLTNDANFQPGAAACKSESEDHVELKIETTEMESPTDKDRERKSPSPIQAPTPSPPRKAPAAAAASAAAFQKSFSPRSRRTRFRNERRRMAPRRSRRDNSSHSNSPPPPLERRQMTRKRSASGSSESSTKSPRRSWIASRPSDAKKYKHRYFSRPSPPGVRSRSTSPKIRKRRPANGGFRKRMPPNSRSNSDDERNHNAMKRVAVAAGYPNDLPPIDLGHVKGPTDLSVLDGGPPPPFGQKQRCVDFESKGYCARGDMCPFDHGPSPIVLDNNLLNGIVPMPPPVHGANFQDAISYTPQFVNASYPPAAKHFRPDNHGPPLPPPSHVPHNRELISVPTVGPLPPHKLKKMPPGKTSYGHVFSSLPPGVSQTTIELTNVPAELNNIPDLYDNFSTFGAITLIQAKRNGDPSTALLTFSNATEAALAFINADTAVPHTKAAWYADQCIMKPFPRKSIPASGGGGGGGGGQTNAKPSSSYVINRKFNAVSAAATTATAAGAAATVSATSQSIPNTAAAVATSTSAAISPTIADEAKSNAAAAVGVSAVAAASAATNNNAYVKCGGDALAEKAAAAGPGANVCNDDKKNVAAVKANENMRQDPGRLLSDLIKKKRELLEKQLASRKEIVEKMKSLEAGGKEEKTWQEMLRKLNDVIAENENSIKISLQQRKEYLQKMNIVPMDSTALNNLKLEKSYQPPTASANVAIVAAAAAATSNATATTVHETQNQAVSSATNANATAAASSAAILKSSDNQVQSSELDVSDTLDENNLFDHEDFSVLDQEMEDDDDDDEDEDDEDDDNNVDHHDDVDDDDDEEVERGEVDAVVDTDDDDDDDGVESTTTSTTRTRARTISSSTLNENAAAVMATKCSSSSQNIALDTSGGGGGGGSRSATSATTTTTSTSTTTTALPEYTRVVVSGFENGDEDDLLQHFTRFGNILDKEFDNTIPSATLIYDNRKSAEDAKKDGRNFQDRLLSVTVYASKKYPPFVRRTTSAAASAAFKPSQYEKEFNSYVPYPGGGNPYKYKNPQMSVTPSIVAAQRHAPTSYRSVYAFRAEQRARIVNAAKPKTNPVVVAAAAAAAASAAAPSTGGNSANITALSSVQQASNKMAESSSNAAAAAAKHRLLLMDDDEVVSASISRPDSDDDDDDDIEDFD